MKKYFLPIALSVVFSLIGAIVYINLRNRTRSLDERLSFKQADKIPYGTAATHELLPKLFPAAKVYTSAQNPMLLDSVDWEEGDQALFFVSNQFNVSDEQLEQLHSFVEKGNYVYIIARGFSYQAAQYFSFGFGTQFNVSYPGEGSDSLLMQLEPSVFADTQQYVFPGRRLETYLYSIDSSRTMILGRSRFNYPNFIRLNAGEGAVFIHTAPMAFTNYFVLHKNNHRYFEQAISVVPPTVKKVFWNEYYLAYRQLGANEPSWLRVLMRNEALKWALLTGLATMILYVLLGMRRKQRPIPAHSRPQNDSLDFVKTLGRLYYDRKDHKNLAGKMGTYFLDHVRTRYKIPTSELDEEFVNRLYLKSGYEKEELLFITGFIRDLPQLPAISESQLFRFHQKLEMFYQNT